MGETVGSTQPVALRRALVVALSASALGATRAQPAVDRPQEISLAADAWHDITRRDGTGLYFDLIRAVYSKPKVAVRIQILPYARAVSMVRDKRVDAWVASFLNEKDFPLYPKWHFDRSAQMVVYRARSPFPYLDQRSLTNRKVAWLRDFGLDRFIKVPMQVTEVDSITSGFGMLDRDRIDFFVGARSDLATFVREARIDMSGYRMDFVTHLGLYLAFANTPKGAALRTIWDTEMQTLHRDATFLAIYEKYGYEVPFDQ